MMSAQKNALGCKKEVSNLPSKRMWLMELGVQRLAFRTL